MVCTLPLLFAAHTIHSTFTVTNNMISGIPGIPSCSWSSSGILYFMSFIFLFVFQLGVLPGTGKIIADRCWLMLSLGLVSLTIIRVIQSWRSAKGHLHAVLVKHNMFYYACGLGKSRLMHLFMLVDDDFCSKVFSAVNVLVPVLFPDVRKPPGTLQYDRVVDVAHTVPILHHPRRVCSSAFCR
jgi:hypothetical protein